MKNIDIYNTAINYSKEFAEFNNYIPAKANFILQKNIKAIQEAAQEIDNMRVSILQNYGANDENNNYIISKENIEVVEKELNDLLELEQDLNISVISIDAFGDVELTPAQMRVIMFMIEG